MTSESFDADTPRTPDSPSPGDVSLPVVEPAGSSMLRPEEHVLSTLEADGSRRWLRPSLSTGSLWKRRRIVAYFLIVVFVAIPHLRFSGKPLIQLDIGAREFTIIGHVFLPTDTMLLALGMVGVFLTIVLVTAVSGRMWCGWGCPQTVYMEYVFRPIDRWFEGTKGRGGKPRQQMSAPMRFLRFAIYLALSMFLAHTFLAYFVGTEKLSLWIHSSPLKHPTAFLVMAGTTVAMLFDFMFFREQMCLIACPYGRFQSVMLDRSSLIVGYDYNRGEPRGKKKKSESAASEKGDCVDCNRCVAVCPTGIDIREGLQMECINCTQCIDACDDVMEKIGRPKRLIGYTSQENLEGKKSSLFRARTLLYPLLLIAVGVAFVSVLSTKYAFDVRILRGKGSPFNRTAAGKLSNSMQLRLVNRSDVTQTYTISTATPDGAKLRVVDPDGLTLESGGTSMVPVLIEFPNYLTQRNGAVEASLLIQDDSGNERTIDYKLLGPRG